MATGSSGDGGKKLLKGLIRNAEFHNKKQDEDDMWKQRRMELQDYCRSGGPSSSSSEGTTSRQSNLRHDRKRSYSTRESEYRKERRKQGNSFQRQLLRLEEADTTRWGHSGYKELHPEDFVSSCSEEKDSDQECLEDRGGERLKKKKKKEIGAAVRGSEGSGMKAKKSKKKKKEKKSKKGEKKQGARHRRKCDS